MSPYKIESLQMVSTPTGLLGWGPLTLSGFDLSYLPPAGLAAARMDVRAFSDAWMPALAIEIVCCSIAS